MKRGLVILVALSIALLMGSSMLLAQEKACAGKEKGTCKKEMKLTDEQKAKIEEMKTNLRLKMIDLKAEREKLAIALKTEMKKPEPSMQEIEGVVKKLSAVREKIQLATIEHRIAMRKLVGHDGCTCGSHGMGEGCGGMDDGHGMMGCGGGDGRCGGKHGRAMMNHPGMGMREGRETAGHRVMVVKTDGSGCTMEPGAPMMWEQRGAGAASGEYKVIVMKEGGKCRPQVHDKWSHRMFRPWGKKNCCPSMSGCAMDKGGKHSCRTEAMKGGCTMEKGAEGCMKKCVEKEIKCTVEITEEKK